MLPIKYQYYQKVSAETFPRMKISNMAHVAIKKMQCHQIDCNRRISDFLSTG